MAMIGEAFECPKCGNGVVVVKQGQNTQPGCCGQPMERKTVKLESTGSRH